MSTHVRIPVRFAPGSLVAESPHIGNAEVTGLRLSSPRPASLRHVSRAVVYAQDGSMSVTGLRAYMTPGLHVVRDGDDVAWPKNPGDARSIDKVRFYRSRAGEALEFTLEARVP